MGRGVKKKLFFVIGATTCTRREIQCPPYTGFLPDPRGAGHAKAFQFLSVGPSVGPSDGRMVGWSVSLIVSVGPSVGRSKDD